MHSKPNKISVLEITVFGMLGAIMYASKALMAALPNIHLIGIFITATTIVFRRKALYPIYIFVFLSGLFDGFGLWWIPYLYIWTILWAMVMLVPKNLPQKWQPVVYAGVCSLFGFLYGTFYAPAQAVLFHLDLKGTIAWIIAGLSFDCIHGISNFVGGFLLIIPLTKLFQTVNKKQIQN